jgi:hypothetical protein
MRISFTYLILSLAASGFLGCSKLVSGGSGNQSTTVAAAKLTSVPGTSLTGNGVSKGSVTISKTDLFYSKVGMVRFDDSWGSKEILVDLGNYTASTHFGSNTGTDAGTNNGSMTLTAQTQNYPLQGGAYPVLTSFYVMNGATKTEFVNLTSGCASSGMWVCSGGYCSENASCSVNLSSTFGSRADWDQHQVPPYGYATTNSFPHCDSSTSGWTNCPASGGLPSGHYYAKYILLSDSGGSVSSQLADLKVTLTVKKDVKARNTGSVNGGINLNLILVGDKNISDSHSVKGARNLSLLFSEVNRLFKVVSGAALGINNIKVYEWSDANGGNQYSQVDYTNLGVLFESGSKGVDAVDDGESVNIFLVSEIGYQSTAFTILGVSGAILGPSVNGLATSGLAFSSFDYLASYNPNCASTSCNRNQLENDFLEMAATIAHELGHYLGLNHPSEKPDSGGVQSHDALDDTPTCYRRLVTSSYTLDQRSCYFDSHATPVTTCKDACVTAAGGAYIGSSISGSTPVDSSSLGVGLGSISGSTNTNSDIPTRFCPAVQECQFNHAMWYTTKNRRMMQSGATWDWGEDGNLFSPQSSALLQWNSFVR